MNRRSAIVLALGLASSACAHQGGGSKLAPGQALTSDERVSAIRRAEVWSPTNIRSLSIMAGPKSKGAFAFNQWVDCDYKEASLTGHSPKFECETKQGTELHVKYGPANSEVFGDVLATRLFWALGFGAVRVNPVRVRCRGCPLDSSNSPVKAGAVPEFEPAIIKQWITGRAMETKPESGWKWSELEMIGPEAGPQARAHRDALKLLAAFVQHSDSKPSQQIIMCPQADEVGKTGCRHPFLMVTDLGLTFGSASLLVHNENSANLARWSETPVWKDADLCVAEVGRSLTGTLRNPKISEEGRQFLAGLLAQLSDRQLRDLFETGRVELIPRDSGKDGPFASVDEWVVAFKKKRDDIVHHHCPA